MFYKKQNEKTTDKTKWTRVASNVSDHTHNFKAFEKKINFGSSPVFPESLGD